MSMKILRVLKEIGVEVGNSEKEVVSILVKHKHISETKIAEILECKINTARKVLYKLSSLGIASYHKKKDEEKKWWFMYIWDLNYLRIKKIYMRKIEEKLKESEKLLLAEQEYEFECKKDNEKFNYQSALENNFACSNGHPLKSIKNQKIIKEVSNRIAKLNKKLKEAEYLFEDEIKDQEKEEIEELQEETKENKKSKSANEKKYSLKKKAVKKKLIKVKRMDAKKAPAKKKYKSKLKIKPKKVSAKKKIIKKKKK